MLLASMRAWRLVPEPEMRTVMRTGATSEGEEEVITVVVVVVVVVTMVSMGWRIPYRRYGVYRTVAFSLCVFLSFQYQYFWFAV